MPLERRRVIFNPCCCNTVNCDTECCLDGALTNTVEIDLGANPLTDEDCGACDTVAGAFQLVNTSECVWTGEFDYECGATHQLDCIVDQDYNGFRLVMTATLNRAACRWSVNIAMFVLMDGSLVALDDSCSRPGSAGYTGSNNDIHCDGTETTLTQDFSDSWASVCVDNMPATITIRVI